MAGSRVPLLVPDLELPGVRVTVSQWLVGLNKQVTVGERLVEILADGVTIDLSAPATGRLVKIARVEDEEVDLSAPLCWIQEADETPPAE